jgi:hypothetical protein
LGVLPSLLSEESCQTQKRAWILVECEDVGCAARDLNPEPAD